VAMKFIIECEHIDAELLSSYQEQSSKLLFADSNQIVQSC
jgi:hypothetical protein